MKTLTSNKAFWLLLVICVVTILPFLGLSEYHTKGEPREAIVSYSMLDSGNWILPRNNGGEMAYKPPFFHWSIAAVSAVVNGGQVTEMTSRLPSAIASGGGGPVAAPLAAGALAAAAILALGARSFARREL